MIVTGIAQNPTKIHDRGYLPSTELVYLASKALRTYGVTRLITSLSLGWDQALAKAAQELKIPYTVAVPYPGRDASFKRDAQVFYYDLLARANEVYQVNIDYCETAIMEAHIWRIDRSDLIFALWEYEFEGETFQVIDYALSQGKEVANLWKDWSNLYMLREISQDDSSSASSKRPSRGARVYPFPG